MTGKLVPCSKIDDIPGELLFVVTANNFDSRSASDLGNIQQKRHVRISWMAVASITRQDAVGSIIRGDAIAQSFTWETRRYASVPMTSKGSFVSSRPESVDGSLSVIPVTP